MTAGKADPAFPADIGQSQVRKAGRVFEKLLIAGMTIKSV